MEIKAKDASLWAKIAAVVILLGFSTLIGLKVFTGMTIMDAIWCSVTVAGIFGTIDLNLMLEKFTGRK